MIFYCFIFALSVFIMFAGRHTVQYKTRNNRYLFGILASFPLLFSAALRYNIGTDYHAYAREYRNIFEIPFQIYNGELGFYYLNKLLRIITNSNDPIWLFTFCAVVFSVLIFLFIIDESDCPELSIFLLFGTLAYFASYNGMQQMTGCAILLWSIKYVQKREIKNFLICIFLATVFHYSCVIFVFVYFIPCIKLKNKTIVIITLVIVALSNVFSELFIEIVARTTYSHYFETYFNTGGSAGYISLAIQVIILIGSTIVYQNNEKYHIYYILQAVNTIFGSLGQIPYLARRVQWLFTLPLIILIPMVIGSINNRNLRLLVTLCVVILYFIYGYYLVSTGSHGVVPYKSIFNKY